MTSIHVCCKCARVLGLNFLYQYNSKLACSIISQFYSALVIKLFQVVFFLVEINLLSAFFINTVSRGRRPPCCAYYNSN